MRRRIFWATLNRGQLVLHVAGLAAGVRGENRYTATVNQLAARNVSFATSLSVLTSPMAAEVTVRAALFLQAATLCVLMCIVACRPGAQTGYKVRMPGTRSVVKGNVTTFGDVQVSVERRVLSNVRGGSCERHPAFQRPRDVGPDYCCGDVQVLVGVHWWHRHVPAGGVLSQVRLTILCWVVPY